MADRRRELSAARTGVLYVHTATLPPLGADTWVHTQIIRHLDRSAYDVHVACRTCVGHRPTPTYDAVRNIPDVHVIPVNLGRELAGRSRTQKFLGLLETLPATMSIGRLAWFVRRRGVRIVHTSDRPRDAAASILVARLGGARSVVHVHVGYNPTWMGRLLRWSLAHADALVAISEFVAGTLVDAGIDSSRIHVVPNGIDVTKWVPETGRDAVRRELGLAEATPVVATVCRLFPAKGPAELIRAIARVREQVSDVVLLVVGEPMDPAFGDELATLARELCPGDNIRFLGRRPDVQSVMAAADVFAMPSHEEPFGLVFLEALAMRRPVVALADSGTLEVVEHGKSGFLSTWGDVDQLATDLRTLLLDPELRASMGTYGRRQVEERFTVQRMAERVARLYPLIAS